VRLDADAPASVPLTAAARTGSCRCYDPGAVDDACRDVWIRLIDGPDGVAFLTDHPCQR